MEAIIRSRPEFIELDLINFSLTIEHLIEILENLIRIEELSVTSNKPEGQTLLRLDPSAVRVELITGHGERHPALSF